MGAAMHRWNGIRRVAGVCVILVALAVALGGCSVVGDPTDPGDEEQANATVARFKAASTTVARLIESAYGYAVIPEVGKGGAGIGAALGSGRVYEQGRFIGTTRLYQGTIGFQLGGQIYSELILFDRKSALDEFTRGNFELSAQASAVAVVIGAAADVPFRDGIAVLTMAKTGLMYEASVGGQKFSFRPA